MNRRSKKLPSNTRYIRISTAKMSLSEISRNTGLSVSYLSRIFDGKAFPRVQNLNLLAKCFKTTPERIFAYLHDIYK